MKAMDPRAAEARNRPPLESARFVITLPPERGGVQ
jgi:hypothetical protein